MPFPYLVTPAGKSREALCPRHNTDILQRVRGRHTHTQTHRGCREGDRQTGRGGVGEKRRQARGQTETVEGEDWEAAQAGVRCAERSGRDG